MLPPRRGSSPAPTAEDATLRPGPSPSPNTRSQRGVPACHPTTRPHPSRRAPDRSAVRPRAHPSHRRRRRCRPRPPAAARAAHRPPSRSRSGRADRPRAPAGSGGGRRAAGSAKAAGKGKGAALEEAAPQPPAEDRRRRSWPACWCCSASSSASSTPAPRCPAPTRSPTRRRRVVYYSDGTTEMARLGDENRTNVTLDQISEPARNAVLAAENRSFYTDPGISFTGIVRAAWNNVTGGSTQGGSTITQQYVKNAILQNSDQTFSAQVPGAVPGHQAGQQLLEGPDPRELPEHHLLRPRRLRHRVGGQHLLRRARRAAHRRSRARCSPS